MAYRNEVLISAKSIREGVGSPMAATQGMPSTSVAWSSLGNANRATFYPITLDAPGIITKLWWRNGAAVSGNVDIGLYALGADKLPGARLVSSGSTAQAGTGVLQEVNTTDLVIAYPQIIYCALVLDNGTGAIFGGFLGATSLVRAAGFLGQTTAFPLPATAGATGGAISTSSIATDFGIAFRALVA